MKRFITLSLLLLTLSSAGFAKVRYGVEGGLYVNKMKFNKHLVDTDNRAGFFIGPKLKAALPIGLGVDAALLYSQRSAEFDGLTNDCTKTLNFITLPVNIRWQIGSDTFAPYIATGPQWDCYIGNSKLKIDEQLRTTFEHHVVSWNLGVGLMFLKHVQLGFSWNFPITKSGSLNKEVFDEVTQEISESVKTTMKNKEWTIRLNYYF